MENMEVPQKIKNRTTYDPAIPLQGIYPKKMKTLFLKDICYPVFITMLFTITKRQKKPVPTDG